MNILFVLAHPDDEAFGPAGTIAKLAKEHYVEVMTLCKGDRPGSTAVASPRQRAFHKSMETLGVDNYTIGGASDTKLELRQTTVQIEASIYDVRPSIVYTHNISDIHQDHRLVAEACLLACRPFPTNSVEELYMFELPNTDWNFGMVEPKFEPNVFVDITEEHHLKMKVLSYYETEIRDYPDARSVTAVDTLAMKRGYQVGANRAEAFKQVYRLC